MATKLTKDFKSVLHHVWGMAVMIPIFIGSSYYFKHTYGDKYFLPIAAIFSIYFLINLLIHIVFVKLYWKANDYKEIEVYQNKIVLTGRSSTTFEKSDIERATLVLSYSNKSGGLRLLPTDNFMYMTVKTINGESLLITSLNEPELMNLRGFVDDKLEVSPKLIPLIKQ